MYRIRTADKGRPIIISNRIIEEYSEPNVDTLHKKNLLSLGEDRYLTTLLLKHFPTFRTKFTPDAIAHTIAPESWRVLFSQRRRWINSTVHNLCELVFLPELFGFCCFSMRFFVFVDLLGTLVCVYVLVTLHLYLRALCEDLAVDCSLRKYCSMLHPSFTVLTRDFLARLPDHYGGVEQDRFPVDFHHYVGGGLRFAGAYYSGRRLSLCRWLIFLVQCRL